MVTKKKPAKRPSGLSSEFERGREYEQQEAFIMVTQLVRLTDNEQVRDLLLAWRMQLLEQLVSSNFTIIVEDTYLVVEG